MQKLYLLVPLAPLIGAIIAGLLAKVVGRTGAHTVTIFGVLIATIASFIVFVDVMKGATFNGNIYTWSTVGDLTMAIGFLVDPLTATMMLVVTFV